MRRVYKYPVPMAAKDFRVKMPAHGEIVRMGLQNGELFMWAVVDPNEPNSERKFIMFGTGQDISPRCRYIFTYEVGPLVIHIFDEL